MIALYKFLRILLVCAALFLVLPRPVAAQDGCGALGWLFGCDYELQATQAANENSQAMAQISAQATATALNIDAQQFLASQEAQMEIERIAANERIDKNRIQTELEIMYVKERMAGTAQLTSFNIAALQADALIAVAQAREREEDARATGWALGALALMCVAGAIAFSAHQYRRTVEVQAAPRLLPRDEWQRQAVALLEARGVPWHHDGQRLLAQIDGVWKVVE